MCVRECVCVCIWKCAPTTLPSASNKQQHGTQQAALPRKITDISEESMFSMNSEIPTQKTTPYQTNTSTCCTPHNKTNETYLSIYTSIYPYMCVCVCVINIELNTFLTVEKGL